MLFVCAGSIIYLVSISLCATFDDVTNLEQRFKQISPNIRPRLNQTHSVEIGVYMMLESIKDYDEVSGTLTVVATYILYWYDELRNWNTSDYGNLTIIRTPILETWIPKILIRNMVSKRSVFLFDNDVDTRTTFVRYNSSGQATFMVESLHECSCSAEAMYFPFDSHACAIELLTVEYNNEIRFRPLSKEIYMAYTRSNAEWSIKSDLVESELSEYYSLVKFNIILSRKPKFLFLNLVVPVVFLSFVNLLVFCLPVASGERASMAFTVLLTFVVFISMVTNILPASNAISLFNVFLQIQLFCSILITFCAVWSISHYHKFDEKDTSGAMARILIKASRQYRKRCKIKQNQTGASKEKRTTEDENQNTQQVDAYVNENSFDELTSNELRYSLYFFDEVCFKIFTFVLVLQLITYSIIVLCGN
ncbi:CHRNA7 [Mytilus coruscus]|uniref:CHRNA7 n=1 Tax=Mytilus coruscus TaxID=42192 RepID=A0A6J8AW54_MYTCO|nr:CHRNA7 [Mytilus coruscus]